MKIALALLTLLWTGPTDLEELHRSRSFRWERDTATGREIIHTDRGILLLCPDAAVAIVNGLPRPLEEPVRLENGKVILPAELAEEIVRSSNPRTSLVPPTVRPPAPSLPSASRSVRRLPPCTIVLDAGHGGSDPTGAVGLGGLMEKHVNLDFALRLQRLLEEGGARVVMTRTADRALTLQDRVDVANDVKPDLFVSIHCNRAEDPDPRGYEVWIPRGGGRSRDRESRMAADFIRRELGAVIGSEDRGTKVRDLGQKDLFVLRNTTCPAVLVEVEFLSNRQAERLLNDSSVRQKVAEALRNAIDRFVRAQ